MEALIALALIALGLGLIVAEVYLVPGFNVIGIIGLLLMVFGVGYAFSTFGIYAGIVALLGAGASGMGTFYLMWQSGAWNRFVLSTNLQQDEKAIARESEQRARYLGKVGHAMTPLRPTGVAEIEGDRIEVVTEGEFIAAGSEIRVVAMDRRRYFVRLSEVDTES